MYVLGSSEAVSDEVSAEKPVPKANAAVVATAAASVHAVEDDQHQLPPVPQRIGVNNFDCFV